MKNYKVKAKDLYVGMDFYHVDGTGSYSGGDVIVRISKEKEDIEDELGTRCAGEICVDTKSVNGQRRYWMKPDDIVYPVIEIFNVTWMTKLKWRIRQFYYNFNTYDY